MEAFVNACRDWICDDYWSDIRYLAEVQGDGPEVLAASILLNPLPHQKDYRLRLELDGMIAGQQQAGPIEKAAVLALLERAVAGVVTVDGKSLTLPRDGEFRIRSATPNRDAWFFPLHLELFGREPVGIADRLAHVDEVLRAGNPPFDGLADLTGWLMLDAPRAGYVSSLKIGVSPPVDLVFDKCQLSYDKLRLTLHAHPKLDLALVRVGVRAAPGDGLQGRFQAADKIEWGDATDGRREGVLLVDCPNSESAFSVLMLGGNTVRRQWFVDPAKAANKRLVAIQHFDKDLRMVRKGLFDRGADDFEKAVAALLFLLGFAPAVQLETDSPDIVVATPTGRLAIVECSIRVADVAAKVGKLVDRKGALTRALQASNQPSDLTAALVCRLPRDQIAAYTPLLEQAGILLVSEEELNQGLLRTRFSPDADQLLVELRGESSTPTSPTGH